MQLAQGAEALASLERAVEAGVLMIASKELQESALGLYDEHISRFPVSKPQVRVQKGDLGLPGLCMGLFHR